MEALVTKILKNYFPATFFILICSILVSYPDRNLIQITLGISFMYFWIYFVHRSLHMLPRDGLIGSLNTHWLYHHQPEKLLDRRIELCFEAVTDIGMNYSLLVVQWVTGVWFVPFSVVLMFGLIYTSVHIVNYSIIGSKTHKKHHMNVDTNYGPDPVDHIYGTNHDDTFEDMLPFTINAAFSCAFIYYMKDKFGWVD